jgi:OOP family OmpA-OmpF porin
MVGFVVLLATGIGARSARAVDAGPARDAMVKKVNAKLLAEGRKNQCAFKTDSDVLMPGCDDKLESLAHTLLGVKKKLAANGVTDFKFEVSGHTDATGKPEFDRELSARRAATIAREMVARGISPNEILAFGLAADRPLVTPDDTPAKKLLAKAKNRRYEIQVK